jgi:hypothetical protein
LVSEYSDINAAKPEDGSAKRCFRHEMLFLIFLLLPFIITSCAKPTPQRIVQRYLEAIGGDKVDEGKISKYTTERFRENLLQNALIAQIKSAKGNYFDLLAPLMSREDTSLVQEYYEFKVMYREVVEEKLAVVNVYIRPELKNKNVENKVLESETIHPLLKQAIKDELKLEFLFKLRLKEDGWKIDAVIYPAILEKVVSDRASATVTIPMPEESRVGEFVEPEGADAP